MSDGSPGRERVLAVVPARGGSRRLPRKNVISLAGKPLVAHTIEAALGCSRVEATVVSSEDPAILAIARECGAGIVERPSILAGDAVPNVAVVRHALEELASSGRSFDHVVLLQPTSPLRTSRHLGECLTAYFASGARSAASVSPMTEHPSRALSLEDGRIVPFGRWTDLERRAAELPPAHRLNGAIHVLSTEAFLSESRFVLDPCLAYVMSIEDGVDIDREVDLRLAEALLGGRT